MGICAYCKKDRKLTREHIIPNFIYEYQKSIEGKYVGWNERAKKLLSSEGVIKDVCEDCNNVILGKLDASASRMIKSAGVLTENFTEKTATLDYNYSSLMRWLLKVSFNSARAADNLAFRFKKYIPYILGKDPVDPDDVFVLVGLSMPDYIPDYELKELKDLYPNGNLPRNSEGLSHPFFVRVGWMPQFDEDFVIRVIVIGALVFQIIIFINNIELGKRRSKVKTWVKSAKGRQIVSAKRKSMVVTQLDQIYLETLEFQFERLKMYDAV